MKILFFTQYFWPENFRINDVVKFFSHKDHDVNILTCNPSYPSKKKYKSFYQQQKLFNSYENADIMRVPTIARRSNNIFIILNYITFIFSSFFFGIYKSIFKKYDIIFIFSTSPILSAISAILIKKIYKKKAVIWVLDLWPNTLIDLGIIKNKIIIKLFKKIVSFIYDNSDLIIVQSQSFKVEINKVTSTECFYFSSWPEENINLNDQSFSQKIPKNQKKLKILFTGNIGEAQSFESIIECAKLLKDKDFVQWIIIGDGRWKNKLIKLIKYNNLENHFHLIDSVPPSEIKSLTNHADMLLITLKNNDTFRKTIPGKLYTYLAMGKPIMGMISGDANKVIEESSSGFSCEADDYLTLKDNIIKFSKLDQENRQKLGNNGKIYSEKNFNKSINLDKLEKKLFNI